ncbi:MAG: VPLPA-CTERM sorting domain-containing protein [Pseudomonadota bacterium]
MDRFDTSRIVADTNLSDRSIETRARVDFNNGTIKTKASTRHNSFNGNVSSSASGSISEAFQFSQSGNVDFTFAIDGALSIGASGDLAYTLGTINIFDVTDLKQIFKPVQDRLSPFDIYQDALFSPDVWVFNSAVGVQLRGSDASDGIGILSGVTSIDNAEGMTEQVDITLNGSLDVVVGRTYLFTIGQDVFSRNKGSSARAEADFFNTAVFSFDEPDDTFYSTISGSFLDSFGTIDIPADPSPVPLPAGIPLLLSGLAAFHLVRRRC